MLKNYFKPCDKVVNPGVKEQGIILLHGIHSIQGASHHYPYPYNNNINNNNNNSNSIHLNHFQENSKLKDRSG